jgi:hypothetical protein
VQTHIIPHRAGTRVDASGTRSEVDHDVASDDYDLTYSAPKHGFDGRMGFTRSTMEV